MFDYIDKIITALISFIFCIGAYICKRKLDERKRKKNDNKIGIVIISSLLEEVKTGLDIIKNKQYNRIISNKSWANGMNTIPNEVMLIISAISENVKQESKFNCKDIKTHCKNYFEHITKDWKTNIQYYQVETEEVKKMLEQTLSLLEKNSKKRFPK